MLWSTVGGSRLPSDLVLLRVTAKSMSVSLVFLRGADVLLFWDKAMLCESSGEYPETHIS